MIRRLLALAAISSAAPLSAQAPAPATVAPDYANATSWLCLPGRGDVCSTPLATTALNPNGYGSTGQSTIATDPPLDCFYVYPTVSRDQGMNSDLKPSEEIGAAQVQFARFAGVCRPFAPLYRQMTLGAVAAFSAPLARSPIATSPRHGATIWRRRTAAGRSFWSATARAA